MVINSTTFKCLCGITATSIVCIGGYKYMRYKSKEFKEHKDNSLKGRDLYSDDLAAIERLSKYEINEDIISKATEILSIRRKLALNANTIGTFDNALKLHDEFESALNFFTSVPSIITLITQEYIPIEQRRKEEEERIRRIKKVQDRRDLLKAKECELDLALRTAKKIGNYLDSERKENKNEEDC